MKTGAAQEGPEQTIARDWVGSNQVPKGAFEVSLEIPPGIQLPLRNSTGLMRIFDMHLPSP